MKVHVTGGSGFLGGWVIPRLASGHHVSGLARSDGAARRLRELGAEPIWGDLDDGSSVVEAFRSSGAHALVNLASLGFGHAPTIVAAAEEAGMRRAVFVSTTAIFTKLNARSKSPRLEAEALIQASALDWTIVRPSMIYGAPGDRNMARLLRLLQRSPIVPLPGGGNRLQQPVHVDDLAHAIVGALDRHEAVGTAYDVAGPRALSLREVVEQAAAAVGRRPRLVGLPLGAAIVAVRAYERVVRHPRLRAEQIERLAEDKAFDIDSARADLGFSPRSFEDGIREEAGMLA